MPPINLLDQLMSMRTREGQSGQSLRARIGSERSLGPAIGGTQPTPDGAAGIRLAFLVAGFAIACWAPLVPYARQRLNIDEGLLGVLLLCLGLGSVVAMAAAAALSNRFGTRRLIVASGLGLALTLPFLAATTSVAGLGLALAAFGLCLGTLDVAMNLNALAIEQAARRPLMSGFHALYSIGGFLGAALMTGLLSLGLPPVHGTWVGAALAAVAVLLAQSRLRDTPRSAGAPLFVRPRGIVLVMALLACVTFLVEGAILDWSALLITGSGLVAHAQGGLGFMLFSVAMTVGRLLGDAIVTRLGDRSTLLMGGTVAVIGIVAVLLANNRMLALGGFVLIGFGASNLVPVLFRQAARQKTMVATHAVATVTMAGYAGVLLGPAVIGFIANETSLTTAFWLLAGLLLIVPVGAHHICRIRAATSTLGPAADAPG